MEFKQNKFLPSEKQIVTASPDINTVSVSNAVSLSPETSSITLFCFFFTLQVELCGDDDFLVLACDGIW